MVRSNPAQLTLAFDSPEDWAGEALRTARLKVPCRREPRLTWANYPTTAGRAFFREFEIRLSSVVLKTQHQIYDTVLHEYAHLVVFEEFGVKAKPFEEKVQHCTFDFICRSGVRPNGKLGVEGSSQRISIDAGKVYARIE